MRLLSVHSFNREKRSNLFCSTIIPTIGRSTLSRAVHSVLDQTFTADDFEVIVVNDSGQPLSEADWQQSERVKVIHTNRRERSVARNTGAAVATGRYLHFLDDDDWLLPGALEEFWTLAQRANDAVWLYGGGQLVDSTGERLKVNPQYPRATNPVLNLGTSGNCFVQAMAGVWIPIPASLIKTESFFIVGGFHPLIFATQDLDLCRRIALLGDFANTPAIVLNIYRGASWNSTTNYDDAVEFVRQGRNQVLSQSGTFARMRASASSSYWHGRILHTYLSTMRYNLQHRNLSTAVSRAVFGLASFVLAGRHIFSPNFWRAVKAHHVTETLLSDPSQLA